MPQLTNQQRVEAMAGVGLFAAMDADQRRSGWLLPTLYGPLSACSCRCGAC